MAVSVIGVVHGLGKRMKLFTAAGRGWRVLTTTVNDLLRNEALPALLIPGLVPIDLVFSVGPAEQLNLPVRMQHTNDLRVHGGAFPASCWVVEIAAGAIVIVSIILNGD